MILPLMMTAPPPAALSTGNWAGYEWYGNDVAAAQFQVPNFPYHKMSSAEKSNHTVMAMWAGLFNYPAIEQIGIYDYVDHGHVGWAGFCAWWPTTDVSCGKGITAGDEIFVKVQRHGLTYTMTMRDAGPHNVWSVSVKKTLNHKDTTAVAIMEDTQYPGYAYQPLTYFGPERVNTSPSPSTEVFSPWGYAKKLGRTAIEILHR